MNDPDDMPPEPAPGLTEQDIGFVSATLDRIRAGGPQRIVEEAEAAVEADPLSNTCNTPYMQELMGYDRPAYMHAQRWRPILLACLQLVPNVLLASKAARVHRVTVYRHRQEDPAFNAAVIDAEEMGAALVYGRCHARATEGDLEPLLHQGVVVHHKRKFDTTLQLAMLRAHYPDKFAPAANVRVSGKVQHQHSVGDMDEATLLEAVSLLSPIMLARQMATAQGQQPAELPMSADGGFIALDDVRQAKAKEVQS